MAESKIKFPGEVRVFVYGTLKPGEANYQKYCEGKAKAAQRAFALGKLFALPMGYPAMMLGEGQVQGYLLFFTNSGVLKELDDLEGYHPHGQISENLYNRQYIKVFEIQSLSLGYAWAYLMTPDRVFQLGGIPQFDGWWSGCGLTANRCYQV
ncbi:gamma-glutamylcyclotransferase family protein [Cylindrospermum sp. FACHB-282]|uniref:gamma-glutamylcyclotransferase family protein n=1 Tax=Cylindrospermum sp. FACHB-282 TaxID=2692794 RepID=UPI0016895158|nr:gamma-glutamylcyclotransferase [Cylindrospermum sp. FACHB-282]MBD2386531.1 gamma-glutamylcyclotransferase [Cylindrospermum sp. FACHB-282]